MLKQMLLPLEKARINFCFVDVFQPGGSSNTSFEGCIKVLKMNKRIS